MTGNLMGRSADFLTKIKKICNISNFCDYTVPELIIGGGGGGMDFYSKNY